MKTKEGELKSTVAYFNSKLTPTDDLEKGRRLKRVAKAVKAGIFEIEDEGLSCVRCHVCNQFTPYDSTHLVNVNSFFIHDICICKEHMKEINAV